MFRFTFAKWLRSGQVVLKTGVNTMSSSTHKTLQVFIQQQDDDRSVRVLPAQFGTCLLKQVHEYSHPNSSISTPSSRYDDIEQYQYHECKINVRLDLENDRIIIVNRNIDLDSIHKTQTGSNESADPCYPLAHPPTCPPLWIQAEGNQHLRSKLPDPLPKIRVGVAVLLEKDDHVLITRRAKHMRTFPWRWVVPGGHVDPGETLESAAAREIREETGIDIRESDLSMFAFWESCFPPYLTPEHQQQERNNNNSHGVVVTDEVDHLFCGVPARQHLLVYMKGKLRSPNNNNNNNGNINNDNNNNNNNNGSIIDQFPNVTLQVQEVDAAAWVSISILEQVLCNNNNNKQLQQHSEFTAIVAPPQQADTIITTTTATATTTPTDNNHYQQQVLLRQFPISELHGDKISAATQFLLRKWLNEKRASC